MTYYDTLTTNDLNQKISALTDDVNRQKQRADRTKRITCVLPKRVRQNISEQADFRVGIARDELKRATDIARERSAKKETTMTVRTERKWSQGFAPKTEPQRDMKAFRALPNPTPKSDHDLTKFRQL